MRAVLARAGAVAQNNAIALLALFVALGGTATALQRNSVGTPQLKNNAVKTKKIAPGAVRAGRIGSGAVTTRKLANGAVGTAKLAEGAVGTAKLATGSVTAAKIAPGAVGANAFAAGALGAAAEVVTVAKRQVAAPPSGNAFNETVLLQRPPLTVTARCVRNGALTRGEVYVQSTVPAITLPIGNPATTITVEPGAPRLAGTAANSANAPPGANRGAVSVWVITDAGRYANLGVFVGRDTVDSTVICTFGASGFAN